MIGVVIDVREQGKYKNTVLTVKDMVRSIVITVAVEVRVTADSALVQVY